VDAAGFLLNTTSITGSDNTMALSASADLTGSAVFLAGATQTFSFSNIGGTGSVSAQVDGGTNGITGSQVLQSLNAQLAAYGISAGTDSSGKLTFTSSQSFDLAAVVTGGGTDDVVVTAGTTNSAVSTATTTDNAKAALTSLNAAVKSLGTIQGIVGTAQNQLGYAIQLAQSQISNFSAAESRIRDADVAAEAANLTKAQVLQQASIAAMAQANSAPQAVLSLLRG
jgi:flagellin